MKRAAILIILIAFYGCKEISFKEPQPKGTKSHKTVPQKMWGRYVLPSDESNSKDTLFVTSAGYNVGHDIKDSFPLSDSIVLKSFKGFCFLSINDGEKWILRILKQDKRCDLVYMTLEQENVEFPQYLQNLATEIKIDSVQLDKQKLYQIDPTPKQLVSLIKKGYVKEIVLKKMK